MPVLFSFSNPKPLPVKYSSELQIERECYASPEVRDAKYQTALAEKEDCLIMDNDAYTTWPCTGCLLEYCYEIKFYGPVQGVQSANRDYSKDCKWQSNYLNCADPKCAREKADAFITEAGTKIQTAVITVDEHHLGGTGTFYYSTVYYTTTGECIK